MCNAAIITTFSSLSSPPPPDYHPHPTNGPPTPTSLAPQQEYTRCVIIPDLGEILRQQLISYRYKMMNTWKLERPSPFVQAASCIWASEV